MEEVRALGFLSLPVTVIDGKAIGGFRPEQLAMEMAITIKAPPRGPAVTIPLIGKSLEAVERAVRQMPDEHLDWRVPDRNRPMCEFTYHIFMVVQKTVEEMDTGRRPPRTDALGRDYTSFAAIAAYGQTVIDRYRTWASQVDTASMAELISEENGRTGAEFLDVIAGHTVHHLRQLYAVLEGFGVTPANRVADAVWPAEYVLASLW